MKSFRPDKMAAVIRSIVSEMIAEKIQDPRVSPFTSVTRVEVSGDLQIAKVHVSVMGDETQGRKTLRGLEHAAGHFQRAVAAGIKARHCPHLHFVLDSSIKKAAEILKIINENVPPDTGDDSPEQPPHSPTTGEEPATIDGDAK